MVAPLLIGAGLAGAGILGSSLMGGKASAPDIGPLLDAINREAQTQTSLAKNLPGQLSPLGPKYQAGVKGALSDAEKARQTSAQEFLNQLGQNQTLTGQSLNDLLTRQAYANVPGQEEKIRENLAATGGLQRGAAATLLGQPELQAAEQVQQGLGQLNLQQQQQRAAALDKINTMDENFIQQKLGIDRDTLTALYQTGREDLINEANQLLGISQNQTQQLLGAEEFGLEGQIAANAANQAAKQAPFQQLSGLGGTLLGYGALSGAGGGQPPQGQMNPLALLLAQRQLGQPGGSPLSLYTPAVR